MRIIGSMMQHSRNSGWEFQLSSKIASSVAVIVKSLMLVAPVSMGWLVNT